MRKIIIAAAALLIAAAGIAKLVNGFGATVTVTQAWTRIQLPGSARHVDIINGAGGTVYAAYNCTTSQFAVIVAATNAIAIPASTTVELCAESGPYESLCLQSSSGAITSTVVVAAQ